MTTFRTANKNFVNIEVNVQRVNYPGCLFDVGGNRGEKTKKLQSEQAWWRHGCLAKKHALQLHSLEFCPIARQYGKYLLQQMICKWIRLTENCGSPSSAHARACVYMSLCLSLITA